MGLALFKDRRINNRKKLTGMMPGRLVIDDTKEELTCRPVDVSNSGVGILIPKEIEKGKSITLYLHDRSISFKVAWVQRDFGKQDIFRYGLAATDLSLDIESIFIAYGCLK